MTEQEWLHCTDPRKMYQWLQSKNILTNRSACCFGLVCGLQGGYSKREAKMVFDDYVTYSGNYGISWMGRWCSPDAAPRGKLYHTQGFELKKCQIMRCVMRNPFFAVYVDENVKRHPTVKNLAKLAYQEKSPEGVLPQELLLLLSDALEECGCDIANPVLAHLRSGEHYFGCHVVEILLEEAT